MVFSSVVFVFVFLPIVLIMHTFLLGYSIFYQRAKKLTLRDVNTDANPFGLNNVFLLLASLFFYAWGEPYLVIFMIISATANYAFGLLLIAADNREGRRKFILIMSLVFNLGLLGYRKYMNLFVDSGGLNLINVLLPASFEIKAMAKVALPLGISFYTFQGMSYVIDVYRKDVRATLSLVDFSCYLTMFPQLVAGPIVRYSSVEEELRDRKITCERFAGGASRFIIGLAKKLLIADTLAKVADAAFSIPADQLPAFAAWTGMVAYALQIYYDFCGYSDMAIGMGHMLGFTFPENFNYPYIADSMRDYWRRWHISLSTWFRDYLFIPLGGSRRGVRRTAFNLLIVFALCGLWHGASWLFLAWGLYHGFFLALERIYPHMTGKMPKVMRHIYVIGVFLIGWVLFRANSFEHAWAYYKSLMGFHSAGIQVNLVWLNLLVGDVYLAFIIGTIGVAPLAPWLKIRIGCFVENAPRPFAFACCAGQYLLWLLLLLICFLPLFGATFTQFIYFRF
jgi:alginate O-acetyltransferase complex protein AlgI